ncbi:putative peptidoglycan lipid II flippase [Diaminobutyricimonas aerilata]|uniref:Putative peptidoglycan lipid II flippase n=1 Tax=Diaminobutyricimonas aerilata TaxID=1162967 RepID=A0A2M9CP91_9MICO|nr:murein biosynthesis integral membrane protein MurJ [Diaminobutyricimonas aerilata]PJJ73703.1 putative peptidoglycan lipid II flippase [Diaminobutyricimonas aerilata]
MADGVGRASALLASGTLVSRVLGFIKLIVLANTLGVVASPAANAFGLANQLPNNVYALIAGGLLGAVLVPQIVRASKDPEAGERFINKLVTLGVVGFAALTVVATLLAYPLVHLYARATEDDSDGFGPTTMALAIAFAWWCLPQIFFYALYSLLGEVLNARGMFGPFTWAPVVNNVVAIIGLIVVAGAVGDAASDPDTWNPGLIALLGGSATAGVAAQALVLTLFWRRAGLRFRPDFAWRGVGLGRTGKAAGWVFGMVLVTQVSGVVQSQVASIANDDASIAALQAAWLVFMLPHSVVAVSIATAYFTGMSGHADRGDLAAVRADVSASVRSISLIVVFASVALSVVALPLAYLFEQRPAGTVALATVLIAYLVGLAPFSVQFVLQRAFYALHDTRTPFFIQLAQVGVFLVGALVCTTLPVAWIGPGLALVTSLAGVTQTVVTAVVLRRRLGGLDGALLVRRLVQFTVFSLAAGAVGVAAIALLGAFSGGFPVSGFVGAIVSIVLVGVVMAAAYGGLLLLARNPEAASLTNPILNRFRRNGR